MLHEKKLKGWIRVNFTRIHNQDCRVANFYTLYVKEILTYFI